MVDFLDKTRLSSDSISRNVINSSSSPSHIEKKPDLNDPIKPDKQLPDLDNKYIL
jgi:hypothetical protein